MKTLHFSPLPQITLVAIMPGPVRSIQVFTALNHCQVVDGRDKPGHDGGLEVRLHSLRRNQRHIRKIRPIRPRVARQDGHPVDLRMSPDKKVRQNIRS